jgi:hypothetical protein
MPHAAMPGGRLASGFSLAGNVGGVVMGTWELVSGMPQAALLGGRRLAVPNVVDR